MVIAFFLLSFLSLMDSCNSPVSLGQCVPPSTRYAVSVSLPKWKDNIDYEKGEDRVLKSMVSGYPRFFIAKPIQALVTFIKDQFALPNETAVLFPSMACAERCVQFIYDQAPKQKTNATKYAIPKPGQVRIVQYVAEPISKQAAALDAIGKSLETPVAIFCVLLPEELFPLAKQYWQHTGDGITARLADYCLHIAHANEEYERAAELSGGRGSYRRSTISEAATITKEKKPASPETDLETDAFVEERFGRNFDAKYAKSMKAALRRRIAGALSEEEEERQSDTKQAVERGVSELDADDVYLVSTGMGAIFCIHQALLNMRSGKSVCFGFPYTDTLKILQKFGPGAYFLGHGEGDDYDELERILEQHSHGSEDPILAIFTECPSNPLLKTADLPRLRELADRYGAALVVDETIGNFVNVDALSWADVVVSSLTKVFSGDSNVMGGSIVLNPKRPHYSALRTVMTNVYEDLMWCEDAVFLERNSRDFVKRVETINQNALAVAELLSKSDKVVKAHYPKYTTTGNYAKIMRPTKEAGYGGLLSIELVGGEEAAQAFYDSLSCYKGPSLGTNFTLASPYTILAHFDELDWAAQYGVRPDLVRISVGMEPQNKLVQMFQAALDAIPVTQK